MVHWHIEPQDTDAYAIEAELRFSTDEPDVQTDSTPEINCRLPQEPSTWRMGDEIEVLVDLPTDVEQEGSLTWVGGRN